MRDYYFIFNGIDSRDMGIDVVAFPEIIKPERNIEIVNVQGRNNNLYIDYKTYNSYNISIECTINKLSKNKQSIDKILSWLDGFGELIISQERDKIYSACIKESIGISNVIWVFPKFIITFEVQPFKKSVNYINEELEITRETILNNIGTIESSPIITIYGNGDINLNINNNIFLIKNIEDYITINSEYLEVYKDNINQNNKYNNFEFPKFKVGENIISFSGNVNKIKIQPNWGWV